MTTRSIVSALALVTLAGAAGAQDFADPHFFVWGWQRPTLATIQPRLTNMVMIDGYGWGSPPDPVLRAQWVAAEIINRIEVVGDLDAGHICLTFDTYARDKKDCDHATSAQHTSPLRAFREEDRLPNFADVGTPVTPGFPHDDTDVDFASNRAYRHPFLINAGATPFHPVTTPCPGEPSALRCWTQRFIAEYRRLQVEVYPNLPTPTRCYVDSEISISYPFGLNPVAMLRTLAARPEFWDRVLPGDPDGYTLHQRYDADAAAYGFPASIFDSTLGLRDDVPAEDSHNRPFLIWFNEVCARADAQILKHSLFDVIHAAWPEAVIACGNYNHETLDYGVAPGNTGWFMDWDHPYNAPGQRGDRVPKNTYPRCWIERLDIGALMEGVGPAAGNHRWLALGKARRGEVDSPELYSISPVQHLGWNGSGWAGGQGHQQPNLYLPPVASGCSSTLIPTQPCETPHESALRLARHSVESTIESEGGGHEDRLVAWLEMAWTVTAADPDFPDSWIRIVYDDAVRSMLAMLRGKNIREAIFFTNWNSGSALDSQQSNAAHAWESTATVIKDVYATRVDYYKRRRGELLPGGGDDNDANRLEFTLNVDGAPRRVELESETIHHGNGYAHVTEVDVTIAGLSPFDYPFNQTVFSINIECAVDKPGVDGVVAYWDWTPGQEGWRKLGQVEDTNEGHYRFWAPKDEPTGEIQSRRTHTIHGPTFSGLPVSDDGIMLLRLIHLKAAQLSDPQFVSRYDLVQVVPHRLGAASIIGGGSLMMPGSDTNHDQSVDAMDLVQFLDDFGADKPAADVNLDDSTNASDLVEFLEDFAEEV